MVIKAHSRKQTIRSSNTTIKTMRDSRVCFVIGGRTTRRNLHCPARLRMRLAQVVTHSNSQILRARSVRSVTQTRRVERSSRFHRSAVSASDLIMHDMRRLVQLAPVVIDATVVGWVYQFRRDLMLTSLVLAAILQTRRRMGATSHRAARVISSDASFALRSRQRRIEWVSVTPVMMRLRS